MESLIKKIKRKCLDNKEFLLFADDQEYLIKIWQEAQKEILEEVRVFIKKEYSRCIASDIDLAITNKFNLK